MLIHTLFATLLMANDGNFWQIIATFGNLHMHPPSVGMIYPISTYIFKWHILPKLLASFIQYKYIFLKMCISPTLCPHGTQKPSNSHSSSNIQIQYWLHKPYTITIWYILEKLFVIHLVYLTMWDVRFSNS